MEEIGDGKDERCDGGLAILIMHSVLRQLEAYLKSVAPAQVSSGELQRREWHNKKGTKSTPRSVVRRLEELAEVGVLKVEIKDGHAHYSYGEPAKRTIVQVILPDGTRAVREVLEAPAMPLNADLSPVSEELVIEGLWSEKDPWTGMCTGITHEIYG